MKQILLISGKAQHGKDSTANFLKEKLIGKSLIIHNADYLKYVASQYLGWDGKKDDYGRNLLQSLGTDKVRIFFKKPLFWVEKTCDIMDILYNDFDYFLVPDTRFRNECYLPQARFPGIVSTIRVERLDFDNGLSEEQKSHLSETDLDNYKFDYYIQSKSGLDNLEKEVNKFLENFIH